MTRLRSFVRAAALGAAAGALLAGCEAAGPADDGVRRSSDRGGPAPESPVLRELVETVTEGVSIIHDDWQRLGYRWNWTARPYKSRSRNVIDHVDAMDDVLVVQDSDSWLTVFEEETGERRWVSQTTPSLTRFLGNDEIPGGLLLSSSRTELFMLELSSGNVVGRQPTDVVISTPPAILGGLAIYGTPTGEVLAHRFGDSRGNLLPPPLDRGQKAWGYLIRGGISARPVLVGELVGVVSDAGDVVFLDVLRASAVGRARIAGGVAADPVTDGTHVFIASLDQSVYAFAPFEGRQVWRYRTDRPVRTQPRVHEGVLYIDLHEEGMHAFDFRPQALADNRAGDLLWSNAEIHGEVVGVRGGELLVWDGESATLVDTPRGDVLQQVRLPQIQRLYTDAFVDGNLYAIAKTGVVVRFTPR